MRTISGGPEELVLRRLLSNHTYPQVEHECYYGLGMDALVTVSSWNTNVIMAHGCSCERMLLEHERYYGGIACRMLLAHERYYGLDMDALLTVCSWNTNVIMQWAWMHCLLYALGIRTLLWFGHGCSGEHMLLEHGGGCTCSKPSCDISHEPSFSRP